MIRLLLLSALFAGVASAQGVPIEGGKIESLKENERTKLRKIYHRKIKHYNALVMGSGSTQDPEALMVKQEIMALKIRIEALPKEETTTVVRSSRPAVTVLTGDFQKPPSKIRETLLLVGGIAGLALIGYGIGWRGAPYKKPATAVIKCPTCGKKLRVPKKDKRVKVRCPECGVECAYNPKKKKG